MARTSTIRQGSEKVAARTTSCAGCRERFPRRELIELHPAMHDNLHYFHGERLRRPCAKHARVRF